MLEMLSQEKLAHFQQTANICPTDMSFAPATGKDSLAAFRLPTTA